MQLYPRLRLSLWILNLVLAGAAAWLVWAATRPPPHALAPEAPPEVATREPIELPPVEVVADRPSKPRPPRALEASLVPSGPLRVPPVRVEGEASIQPPRTTLLALARQGIEEEDVSVTLCLDSRGVPVSSHVVTSSGLADLEAYVSRQVMRWRYLPLLVGGDPAPTCTRVHLRYLVPIESRVPPGSSSTRPSAGPASATKTSPDHTGGVS